MTESEDFSRSRPNAGRAQASTEAERLRTQARRALELARDVTGQEAAPALKAYAAELLERADARAKGPTCPTRARNTSFSIVNSPIRFIAAVSSSLTASPSRSRNDPSIPDKARSHQRSSRYDGTPSSRERFSIDLPRSRRSTTSRLRPTLQRCPGARPPAGKACPMESVDGLRPPSLPTGPTKAADDSRTCPS